MVRQLRLTFQLYVDTAPVNGEKRNTDYHDETEGGQHSSGHPFAGYYLPYPDTKYEGIVSTICDDAPILNWIYIDMNTYEVKYGVRADAQSNITGPFDCTRQDRRMTLEGWEGFVAVEVGAAHEPVPQKQSSRFTLIRWMPDPKANGRDGEQNTSPATGAPQSGGSQRGLPPSGPRGAASGMGAP